MHLIFKITIPSVFCDFENRHGLNLVLKSAKDGLKEALHLSSEPVGGHTATRGALVRRAVRGLSHIPSFCFSFTNFAGFFNNACEVRLKVF